MEKYRLYIRKYNIMKNDYVTEEREVLTNDIYHEIGKIYCTTIEDIKRIGYVKIDVKQERINKAIDIIENDFKYDNDAFESREFQNDILKALKGE